MLRTLVVVGAAATAAALTPQDLLAQMNLKQKVGQLTQINVGSLVKDVNTLDPNALASILGNYSVGHILGTAVGCNSEGESGTSLTQFRELIQGIQAYAMANTNITPPIPVLYGLDSVHGANFLDNATWFPQSYGLAASFDPSLARAAATIAALDTRAIGASWIFAPILGLGMNPLWSRLYETYGEDPHVGATFGAEVVRGFADASKLIGVNYSLVNPTIKHYAGYSNPRTGKDRTDAWIPDAYFKQYFQPSFEAALRASMESAPLSSSVMVNSASINGLPAHANPALLTDLLRDEIGCSGCVALTDWQDILKVWDYHNLEATYAGSVQRCLSAGIDVSMVPYDTSFADVLIDLVQNGTFPESAVDASVLRVLQLKIDMGLFEASSVPPQLQDRVPGNPQDQAVALQAARASMTLLQNNATAASKGQPILPLSNWLQSGATVFVTGPSSVDITALCGGWSLPTLAGGNGACGYPTSHGSAIVNATRTIASGLGIQVTGFQGCTFSSSDPADLATATQMASQADVVVLAIGETPEKETEGDIEDLSMSPSQMALFNALQAAGKPIITVLVEPRPRVLGPIATGSAAILMAYLPCTAGGQAIAETLFGINNPSGRLTITYPSTTGDLDVYWHKPWSNSVEYEGVPSSVYHNPLFTFGYGISYSTLNYSQPWLSQSAVAAGANVTVSVNISNTGSMDVNESVLVFVRQLSRAAITPEVMLLKAFTKQAIPHGTTAQVDVQLPTSSFAYWTPDLQQAIDAGVYSIIVGVPTATSPSAGGAAQLTLTSSATFEYAGPGRFELQQVNERPKPASLVDELVELIDQSGVLDARARARSMRVAQLRDLIADWAAEKGLQ
jgi:beta-glucosidase